jgi:type VI protein secretion system component Hcp
MPDSQSDLLMKFVLSGQSIQAGGTSLLSKDDKLTFDFWAGKFFEIKEFGLGLNLSDFEATATPSGPPAGPPRPPAHGPAAQPGAAAIAPPQKAKFAAWRDKKKSSQAVAKLAFPVETEPFEITRQLDRASPLLFESCASTTSFDSATIVKRKVTGQTTALQSYLRIDFDQVLLVGLTWSDGELLQEKVRFICRGLRVQYRQQGADGSLGAAASAEWDQAMALRTAG